MMFRLTLRATIVACAAAVLVFCGRLAGASAETLTLTLDEAIAAGLKNSLDLKATQLAVLSSLKDVKAARAARYPDVTLSSDYSHRFDGAGQGADSGALSSATDRLDISLGLNQTLVTFGRLGASVEAAVDSSDIAKLDLDEKKRSLTVEIKRGFYGYLLSREVLAVKKETLAHKEEALEVARTRYEAGLSTKRDVLKAESDLKSFVPELLTAQNDLEYALLSFKDIVGIENGVDVRVVGELDVPVVQHDREKLVIKALAMNSGIKKQEMSLKLQRAQGKLSKSEKLPSMTGFVNVGFQNGFDLGAGGSRLSGQGWDGTVSAGVSAQMGLSSLFPWSAKTAEVEKNAIDQKKIYAELKALQDTVSLGVERVLLDLSKAKAQIEAGRKALELAEELYLFSKEMYENGLVSITEYGDAQIGLNDGRVGYLTYIHDYRIALCDLMDAIGADTL